jgi:hypothetical protein
VGHVTVPELPSQGGEVWGHGTRGSAGAQLYGEVRSGDGGHVATGHVTTTEPTTVRRCGPKLQLTWHRVDAHPTPYIDLELVCGGTRSPGC